MALYEPIFPTLSPPSHVLQLYSRPSSTPSTPTLQANKDNAASHMDKLKQLYQSLAKVPEELCPPSRPSSPSAQTRTEKLQSRITNAARNGSYLGDLIRLQCTERHTIAIPITSRKDHINTKDKNLFILPETEEEWLEWERAQATRRGDDDKEIILSSLSALKQGYSQSAEEKVKVWKAKLLNAQDDSQENLPSGPGTAKQNSQINFPVVKRSTAIGVLKKGKGRPPGISPSSFYGNIPAIRHEADPTHESSGSSKVRLTRSIPQEAVLQGVTKQPIVKDVEVQSKINEVNIPSQSSTEKKTIADLEDTTVRLFFTYDSS